MLVCRGWFSVTSSTKGRETPHLLHFDGLWAVLEVPRHSEFKLCFVWHERPTCSAPAEFQFFPGVKDAPLKSCGWGREAVMKVYKVYVWQSWSRMDSHLGFTDGISMPCATFWYDLPVGLGLRVSAVV